ncbi:MAG: hypothetical protein RJB11_530 [Planctomycetota bacterium]|jgi:hypothetical protein
MRLILPATLGADIAPPGIACYLYPGPLGHKPSKLIWAVTNPINPRNAELQ